MEKFYQLHHGDVFTISANLFLNTNWDISKFKFIQYNYYPKPWWKFWKNRQLKNVKIMYTGD